MMPVAFNNGKIVGPKNDDRIFKKIPDYRRSTATGKPGD